MYARSVALFDFFEHTVDIGGGKLHAHSRSHDLEFGRGFAAGLAFTSLYQGSPHPFSDRHAAQTRCALDVAIFGVLNDHLKPLSHRMSVYDSSR